MSDREKRGVRPHALTTEKMAAHVDELLRGYDFDAIVGENRSPRGGRRRIYIKPVKSEITYVTSLHEIAHALGKGNAGNRLHQEVVCWQWALNEAKVEPSPRVKTMIAKALRSYHHRALRWKSMKLPEPEHPFWRMIAELEEEPPFRVYLIEGGWAVSYPDWRPLLVAGTGAPGDSIANPGWHEPERLELHGEVAIESLPEDAQLFFFDHRQHAARRTRQQKRRR
jgi:hypothetical protein